MRYKNTVRSILIFVTIVGGIGFFYSNVSQPPFIHITEGKGLDIHRTDSTYYSENILVRNDTFFQSQAIQNGKKVDGLETAEFQFNLLFNGSSLQRQAQLLMCTLNHIETEVENLKRLTNAYMKQDLNTMLKISEERKGDQCDALPGEEDAMIYNRNKAWAEKLPAIMKAAPTFVAVGALHLPGEKGLLNLLKRQGYTVEAVK